ncbi:MAG TPA: hypothetical protein DCY85_12460 [Firmicutes bacterium]|jgi:tetratricopeptide (TPR) repeat protein|nr:hypothetical protein [Bacillota bacterium]HBE07285.1 hypothetical protein [Bacillota bacterium]HBG43451.1 hypothetical protein [Bacillota bacterium]HBL50797.1 hypothetical protein [Bacillota bacterium]HBL67508.1 hypothetical protein [Bacillota bacterium]
MTVNLDFIMNTNRARANELLKGGLFEECRILCQENIWHFQKIAEPSSRQIASAANCLAMRGECAFRSGDFAGARAFYQKAVHLAPRESAYWLRLAQSSACLFEDTGDPRMASESAAAAQNASLLQARSSAAC